MMQPSYGCQALLLRRGGGWSGAGAGAGVGLAAGGVSFLGRRAKRIGSAAVSPSGAPGVLCPLAGTTPWTAGMCFTLPDSASGNSMPSLLSVSDVVKSRFTFDFS